MHLTERSHLLIISCELDYSAVSDDNQAMVACSSGGVINTLTTGLGVRLNAWRIMSGPGTFHTSHPDANGFGTIIQVLEGLKGWLWGRPKGCDGPFFPLPWPGDGEEWHFNLFKNCDIYFVVLGPGDTG